MKYLIFLLSFTPLFLFGQYIHIPLHSDMHEFARCLEIQGKSDLHTSINEYASRDVFNETKDTFTSLSNIEKYLASKLIREYPEYWRSVGGSSDAIIKYTDSTSTFFTIEEKPKDPIEEILLPSKPLLKYFYQNRTYFKVFNAPGFILKVNPVVFFGLGRDISQSSITFENRRGITLSGQINDKVYFYSDILESQAVFPSYVQNFENKFKTIPGNGFYKFYNSSVIEQLQGYDFLNATAYINARISRNINVEFGNNNQFIGNGKRSLLLSDFTNNYLYLKLNTKIWKLHYQNIFAELIPISPRENPAGNIIPRKYMTTHFLSYKHRNLELGIFESVIFERQSNFDLQYLNPVILYRLVEYNLDSSDNVLIGINGKLNIAKRLQFYGQLMMDEFLLRELIIERQGWWANKYGIQAGVRYINVLDVENLNLQVEYNLVRPYTFGHRTSANYSHANQPLAHPLGANFDEINFEVSYYITPKIKIQSENFFIRQGLDSDSILYGANVLRLSDERPSDFGNNLLQGSFSRTLISSNKISYEFFPNYFVDLNFLYRSQASAISTLNFNNTVLSTAIRINFWEPKLHF